MKLRPPGTYETAARAKMCNEVDGLPAHYVPEENAIYFCERFMTSENLELMLAHEFGHVFGIGRAHHQFTEGSRRSCASSPRSIPIPARTPTTAGSRVAFPPAKAGA